MTPKADPQRDRQFQYIQAQRQAFKGLGWPIISVDTKHKELIGPYYNAGRVWTRQATDVYMTDFPSDAVGKAVPYGIYDLLNLTMAHFSVAFLSVSIGTLTIQTEAATLIGTNFPKGALSCVTACVSLYS